MNWIPTIDGCVNADFVIRVERTSDGSILHLTDGTTVKSSVMFEIVKGELVPIEPVYDFDDEDVPF